jgi:hypothetical protein
MAARTAVIVAHQYDIHAHAVRYQVEQLGGSGRVVDIQAFTKQYDLTGHLGQDATTCSLRDRQGGADLDLSEVTGLWWRRPFPLGQNRKRSTIDDVEAAVISERRSAVMGSLDAFVPNAFNNPGRSQAATHKPTQLLRARELGLVIPETLITSNPDEARNFIESLDGDAIYKMFNGTSLGAFGTRHVQETDLEHLDRLSFCPVIFQRFVKGSFDLRVLVIGDKVFAGRIEYDDPAEVYDSRFVPTQVSPHVLPPEVEERLVRLVQSFGLVYSAIDLRFSDELGYVFFESNPEGQFLWIEVEADLPISREIALRLLEQRRF